MKIERPDFATLSRIEEHLLAARLDSIRSSINYAGEKGRALEQAVWGLLRELLPAEYGLSTGFIVWVSPSGPRLSRQLDIIIYDAVRCGPLIRLATCEVFPLEAVYGCVEVKATLRSTPRRKPHADDSIEACVARNFELRQMDTRWYWAPTGGSPAGFHRVEVPWLSVRSYVVAFELVGEVRDLAVLAKRMSVALKLSGGPAHLHGVFIPNQGMLSTLSVDERKAHRDDYFHVRYTRDHPLMAFKTMLLSELVTFDRPSHDWAPAVDKYFDSISEWRDPIKRLEP
jgi:hypothetical protein